QQFPAPCPQHQQWPSDTGERQRRRHSGGHQHNPPLGGAPFVSRPSGASLSCQNLGYRDNANSSGWFFIISRLRGDGLRAVERPARILLYPAPAKENVRLSRGDPDLEFRFLRQLAAGVGAGLMLISWIAPWFLPGNRPDFLLSQHSCLLLKPSSRC